MDVSRHAATSLLNRARALGLEAQPESESPSLKEASLRTAAASCADFETAREA